MVDKGLLDEADIAKSENEAVVRDIRRKDLSSTVEVIVLFSGEVIKGELTSENMVEAVREHLRKDWSGNDASVSGVLLGVDERDTLAEIEVCGRNKEILGGPSLTGGH